MATRPQGLPSKASRRSPASSVRPVGARSRKAGSMYLGHRSGGSMMWMSLSRTLYVPLTIWHLLCGDATPGRGALSKRLRRGSRLSGARPRGLVGGERLERVLLEAEHVLGHDAVGPLAGRRLAVELLVGQADERADEARPLGQPLGDEPLHGRGSDPTLVAGLEHLPRVDLLVIDVVRDERPEVLSLRASVRRRL